MMLKADAGVDPFQLKYKRAFPFSLEHLRIPEDIEKNDPDTL